MDLNNEKDPDDILKDFGSTMTVLTERKPTIKFPVKVCRKMLQCF